MSEHLNDRVFSRAVHFCLSNRTSKQLGLNSLKHYATVITQMLHCNIVILSRGIDTSTLHTFSVLDIGGKLFLVKGIVNSPPFI